MNSVRSQSPEVRLRRRVRVEFCFLFSHEQIKYWCTSFSDTHWLNLSPSSPSPSPLLLWRSGDRLNCRTEWWKCNRKWTTVQEPKEGNRSLKVSQVRKESITGLLWTLCNCVFYSPSCRSRTWIRDAWVTCSFHFRIWTREDREGKRTSERERVSEMEREDQRRAAVFS